MKNAKKLLALLLAVVMCVGVFAGCGQQAAPAATQAPAATEAPAEPKPTDAPVPAQVSNIMKLLTWIRDNLPPDTPVSLMHQYIPCNNVSVPGLDQRVTEKEYRRVRDHMLALDLPGFCQDRGSAEKDFIPAFNREDSFI